MAHRGEVNLTAEHLRRERQRAFELACVRAEGNAAFNLTHCLYECARSEQEEAFKVYARYAIERRGSDLADAARIAAADTKREGRMRYDDIARADSARRAFVMLVQAGAFELFNEEKEFLSPLDHAHIRDAHCFVTATRGERAPALCKQHNARVDAFRANVRIYLAAVQSIEAMLDHDETAKMVAAVWDDLSVFRKRNVYHLGHLENEVNVTMRQLFEAALLSLRPLQAAQFYEMLDPNDPWKKEEARKVHLGSIIQLICSYDRHKHAPPDRSRGPIFKYFIDAFKWSYRNIYNLLEYTRAFANNNDVGVICVLLENDMPLEHVPVRSFSGRYYNGFAFMEENWHSLMPSVRVLASPEPTRIFNTNYAVVGEKPPLTRVDKFALSRYVFVHVKCRRMLKRWLWIARDALQHPPTVLPGPKPTRAALIASLETAGRAYAREYWQEMVEAGFEDLGPVPVRFLPY